MVFLLSIIFYLFVDEPQRRAAFFARFALLRTSQKLGQTESAGTTRASKTGDRIAREERQ
jgi:hypothetical protein